VRREPRHLGENQQVTAPPRWSSHFLDRSVSSLSFLSCWEDAGRVGGSLADEVELRYVTSAGEQVFVPLSKADVHDVAAGRPVRAFASYAGMTPYPGWLWSAPVEDLVGYESLLERDRLLLADFDTSVAVIGGLRRTPG